MKDDAIEDGSGGKTKRARTTGQKPNTKTKLEETLDCSCHFATKRQAEQMRIGFDGSVFCFSSVFKVRSRIRIWIRNEMQFQCCRQDARGGYAHASTIKKQATNLNHQQP